VTCQRAGCACRVQPRGALSREVFGDNGNAWAIMAHVDEGLKKAGWTRDQRTSVREDMTSGDYEHLLAIAVRVTEPETVDRISEMIGKLAEIEELKSEGDIE
jgi:hypothetical protein